jgi:hypothetical protein
VIRFLVGLIVLGLSIAIPLSISARWQVWVIWIVIGVALALLIVLSNWKRLPWKVMWMPKGVHESIGRMVRNYVLRQDLKAALTNLNENLQQPSAAELRAFADNVAKRLVDDGFDVTAKNVEVHLPDNAERSAIQGRRDSVQTTLIRLLIWDEYE